MNLTDCTRGGNDTKRWRCGHEYQTRGHLFTWCKRWKKEQEVLWRVIRKVTGVQWRLQLPTSQVFASEECTQALMDFLFVTDVGRVVVAEEEAESLEDEE